METDDRTRRQMKIDGVSYGAPAPGGSPPGGEPRFSRIGILITTMWSLRIPGGVPSHITDLAKALANAGHQWSFVNPSERFHSPLWKAVALAVGRGVDGGRVTLTKMRLADLSRKIRRAVERGRFSLIHAHDAFAARVARSAELPVVLTVHGPLSREIRMLMGERSPRYLDYALDSEWEAYTSVQRIIAVDSGQRDIMVCEHGVDSRKVCVIPNAVDTELFAPSSTIFPDRTTLLVPRRLVRKNGVDIAIRAMALVTDPRLELVIAGDGPEESHLRRLARELKLSDRIRFLGAVRQRSEMAKLVSQARAVIIPSVPAEGVVEATSIAALEGMSCGVPVFASRLGGLAEIIKDRETGFLFRSGNWEELGNLLDEVLCRLPSETSLAVGHAARSYVQAHHSLSVWVAKVTSVYQEAIVG